ncbi:MAG: anaerobic sulfatase maturase [Lachnospiraceae bacterium]|jgi:uncharacterized protein|nr:anaerobic sulfatase maturase [Lachnospiraceae bacterium 10-1]MCX4351075.1 anaerobic sulfatase maturase [Lachnospiraceae bacterium]
MPPLSVLIKPASGLCNMKCDYCFYCDESKKRLQQNYGFMTENTLKNVIRKTILHAEGSITYAFQGGEPSLRGIDFFRRAIALQKQYNKNNVEVINAFQTNGSLIDEKWCQFFRENQFLVGVSVDGTLDIHDRYRHKADGQGTFNEISENIKLLDKYGVSFNILTVVTGEVVKNIRKIYYSYAGKGWRYQQYIACIDPLGEGHGNHSYGLTPDQYGEFLITLFELWFEDWKKGRQPYIRQFENYVGILLGYYPEACDQRGVCGIQTVVEADGSAYPCDFYMIDEYKLGNLNANRLADLDKKREETGFVQRSLKISDACKNCKYFKICRAGCQRNRDVIKGTDMYENYFCAGYQMFFDQCLNKLKMVAESVKQNQ